MTIRFSCQCGATFEVPDDKAGLLGRCRNCGKKMMIPPASEHVPGDALDAPTAEASSAPVPEPRSYADDAELAVTQTGRYCPYCGHAVVDQALFCPRCLKDLPDPSAVPVNLDTLNTVDWILVTVFAPVGFLGGFVSLVMGNRKGLTMIGISTLSVVLIWLFFVLLGWLR